MARRKKTDDELRDVVRKPKKSEPTEARNPEGPSEPRSKRNPSEASEEKPTYTIKGAERVAIVGFAPSSMKLAPFNDPDIEIWGINEIYTVIPRVDRLFEMHKYERLASKKRNSKHLEWLRKATIPIYMIEHFPDIPQSVPYPRQQVMDFCHTDYFTNSVSWMIGLALLLGTKQIQLWGIDMAMADEYQKQRPSVEYFIGLARGMGAEVIVPDECDLLKTTHLYGYEQPHQVGFEKKLTARIRELTQKANEYGGQEQQGRDARNQCMGAVEALKNVLTNYANTHELADSDKRFMVAVEKAWDQIDGA